MNGINKYVCGAKLQPTTVLAYDFCATYWTHTTAACVLIVALTHLQLPTHPLSPYPLIRAIYDITVTVKQVDIF